MCSQSDTPPYDEPTKVVPQPPAVHEVAGSARESGLDIERLADALHAKVCGPFATIDPQECIHGRQRDVTLATAIAKAYAR